MKKVILVLMVLSIAALATMCFAQTLGPKVSFGTGVMYLDKTDFSWKAAYEYDTLAVSPGAVLNRYTRAFQSPNGYVNLSGTAILTFATDSFKVVLLGSNSQHTGLSVAGLDTAQLTRLDSTKVLAAGLYNYVFVTAGKFKPYLLLEFVALNKATTITGKSIKTSIGVE
jgi:hypothetical protein